MEELEKLQKIGAAEISKNTHIAQNKIQNILQKNFDELRDKATTIGLIHILEREYTLNLTEWVTEYEKFLEETPKENEQRVAVDFKVIHENAKPSDPKKGIIIAIVVIILLGAGYYVYNNFNQISQTLEITSEAIEEVQNTQNIESENRAQEVTQNLQEVKIQEPKAEEQNALETTNPQPLVQNPQIEQTQNSQTQSQIQETPQEAELVKKLEIKPQGNTWIGIIYLDTKEKVSMMIDSVFEIDTKREQTITTGNGFLELRENGVALPLEEKNKFYFYVDKEGALKVLTKKEYNRKNGALKW